MNTSTPNEPNAENPNTEAAFQWPVRVYWEDTDGGGVVYHARYLHFFERARTEWLRYLGFDQSVLKAEHNIVFAISQMDIKFLRAAHLDDELQVSVRLVKRGRASMQMEQEIRRGDEPIARAVVYAGCLKADVFKPTRIPSFMLAELR
jgi:acyl-CoA thioester hydrolase